MSNTLPAFEKSVTYDRESRDFRCEVRIDGAPISLGYTRSEADGERWCHDESYRLLKDGVAFPSRTQETTQCQ